MIQLTQQGEDVLLPVKVVPNASRDRIIGELDGHLKVGVSAAPEKGAANKAVCRLIAKSLGFRTQQVYVDSGLTSPRKVVRITGATIEQVQAICHTT